MTHDKENTKSYRSYRNSPYKSVKYSTYFQVYDEIFSRYRGKKVTFVEVGILDGGSLFMWRDYFGPEARIVGVDLNPAANEWKDAGFDIFIGSQSDPDFWNRFFKTVGNVDIVLDDGGHTFEQQIITTECCLPFINDGGLLVVEDTHTSYLPAFGGPSKFSFMSYAKNKIDGINNRFNVLSKYKKFDPNVFSISFFESFVVFDIRRNYCRLMSEPTDNGGEIKGSPDFRYADNAALEKLQSLGFHFRIVGEFPILGPLARTTFHLLFSQLHRLHNARKNRTLKKFFRY